MAEYSWPAIGHEKIIDFLERALVNNKVAQTYIFVGSGDLGKSTIALAFARNLQGASENFNSDLHILEPIEDKKSISIDQVRDFIKILSLSSFSNSYKIGVIKWAELLSSEAKSALLKTLEEPQDKVIVILLVDKEESLPETILSRAQVLYFNPVPASVIYDYLIKTYNTNRSLAKDLANLAIGRPLMAIKYLENSELYRRYWERAETWLKIISSDLTARWSLLDSLFNDKTWSKQAVESALDTLALAEGLARDLLLLTLGQRDRLQHSAIRPQLEEAQKWLAETHDSDATPAILREFQLIAQAKEYLAANVNPRLVLEQIIINL
jgi:DNA polymerase-3 subunit delta'